MLEQVKFTKKDLSKEEFKPRYEELINRLVVLQQQAVSNGIGLAVVFEGWNGSGKGSRISDLMYNLDARATSVYVTLDVNQKAHQEFPGRKSGVTDYYPMMKEFWDSLGERGHFTFYDRGWYTKAEELMRANEDGDFKLPSEHTRDFLNTIGDFERQLKNDGYIVLKFFMHIRQKTQQERLEKLYDDKATRWRVSDKKLIGVRDYKEIYKYYDKLLEGSNFEYAPWIVMNGEHKRAANLQIAETLVQELEKALAEKPAIDARRATVKARLDGAEALATAEGRNLFDVKAEVQHAFAPEESRFDIEAGYPRVEDIATDLTMDPLEYREQRKKLQKKLYRLENEMYQERIPLVIMYEGWDAAGKGGNIKRVAQALDARAYTIIPSPAPTKPELAHPHLWRYWTRVPKAGHVGLFDRSWYGRVLVERVEEFTPPERWAQGYDEINEFERDLVDWGAILLKFWVNISPDEQLARFKARQEDPSKQWKITDDDWRNREKYPQYVSAINDMFRLTSTTFAPWQVLESDDKKYARIKALRIITDALEERL